jgi:hypothetical protein
VEVDQLGPRSLRQLLDAVLAIGRELDLDRALQHIVETAVALVDARYGALGVLDEDKRSLAAFLTVGVTTPRARRSARCRRASACSAPSSRTPGRCGCRRSPNTPVAPASRRTTRR